MSSYETIPEPFWNPYAKPLAVPGETAGRTYVQVTPTTSLAGNKVWATVFFAPLSAVASPASAALTAGGFTNVKRTVSNGILSEYTAQR